MLIMNELNTTMLKVKLNFQFTMIHECISEHGVKKYDFWWYVPIRQNKSR